MSYLNIFEQLADISQHQTQQLADLFAKNSHLHLAAQANKGSYLRDQVANDQYLAHVVEAISLS